jgi:predicted DNA-binding transcriptional regulator AlpA
MKSNPTHLLNTTQVAEILNVKPATLEKSRSMGVGDFPAFIRFGRNIRYRPADVDAWITSHRIDIREGGML